MPPRLPRFLSLRRSENPAYGLSYCTSCSLWRISTTPVLSRSRCRQIFGRDRKASTLVSTTAIGVSKAQLLEPDVRELFQALDGLKKSAANYVNLSRLQLALQGVEGGANARVRVAVFSLGSSGNVARALVKALLADALGEKSAWEQQLESEELDDGAVLIRYGETSPTSGAQNSLLRTLAIPSPLLKKYNLEIVLSPHLESAVTPGHSGALKDAVLVPSLQTPASANGRFSTVTYPMHKALIFGHGISGAVSFGHYTAGQTESFLSTDLIHVVLNIPGSSDPDLEATGDSNISVVDVRLANSALAKFRESLRNATIYEQSWYRSNLTAVLKWLLSGTTTTDREQIKPAVQDLVFSLLDDVENCLASEESRLIELSKTRRIPPQIQASLRSALTSWSERAHTELRDSLEAAFASRRWHRLRWYKLFWRVDDVSMLAEEVLSRRWLIEAEKEIIWVAGRIEESELDFLSRNGPQVPTSQPTTSTEAEENINPDTGLPRTFLEAPSTPATYAEVRTAPLDDGDEPPLPPLRPWPMQIPVQRTHLLATSVPALQARAQALLFQTLSTSSLSSILGGLLYLSSFSFYEAGAVAAVGVMWSLRRLQKGWETTRKAWETDIREQGVAAVRGTEKDVRELMEETHQPQGVPLEGEAERKAALEGLERAQQALEKVTGKRLWEE